MLVAINGHGQRSQHVLATANATLVDSQTFRIEPRGPFSWPMAVDVLGRFGPTGRHVAGEGPAAASDSVLRLGFPLDGDFAPVAVALRFEAGALVGEVAGTERIDAVAAQVARIFSLDVDGSGYPDLARRDPALAPVMAALPGLRPVCFTSPYETASWAVLSARVSMAQAARVQDRLIHELGTRLRVAGEDAWSFPTPERLLDLGELPGAAPEKVVRLQGVAQAALDGRLDPARLRALGDVEGPASLLGIRGIGPFWSSGIYLRGCGIADVFPDEPLSIAALGQLRGLGDRPDPEVVAGLTDEYAPYRMWVCFLLRVAAGRGIIPGLAGREMAIRRASRG
jgi:DNA-3-methyladenine glycosylase II